MYPTEPILDILVGVNNLHDVTSLDEKRLNYEGLYRLHHPYKKKIVMAQFNNLIELKQITRLHIYSKRHATLHWLFRDGWFTGFKQYDCHAFIKNSV